MATYYIAVVDEYAPTKWPYIHLIFICNTKQTLKNKINRIRQELTTSFFLTECMVIKAVEIPKNLLIELIKQGMSTHLNAMHQKDIIGVHRYGLNFSVFKTELFSILKSDNVFSFKIKEPKI